MKKIKFIQGTILILVISCLYTLPLQSQSVYEYSIKFINDSSATLVGGDGLIMFTENGGNNWTQQQSNTTNVLYGNEITYHVYSLDAPLRIPIGIVVGENGIILQSIDVGNTWNIITSGTLQHLRGVGASDGTENVTVCGDGGTILLSTDVGATFSSVTSGTNSNLYGVAFTKKYIFANESMVGLIVGDNGTILRSEDNGASWFIINSNISVNLRSVAWSNIDDATVVGESGLIYNTTDRGFTWLFAPEKYHENLNSVKYLNETTGIAVGDNGIIIRTTDNGQTWTKEQSNTQACIMSVNFGNTMIGISVGQSETTIYTTDGGITWGSKTPTQRKQPLGASNLKCNGYSVKQNYPNPFNPSTLISYELPKDSKVSLQVYDMTGKEVAKLIDNFQTAGNHSVSFNASNLSSGVYFYKMIAGDYINVKRMILIK